MTYNEIRDILETDAAIVVFIKSNGDKRVMLCTRNRAMAYSYRPGIGVALEARDCRSKNDKTLAVFDIEKNDVRAFMVDKVISVESVGDLRELNSDQTTEVNEKMNSIREQIENGTFAISAMDSI